MAKEENLKFRFMIEMPNNVKFYSSDEELLSRILEKCGLSDNKKIDLNSPIESTKDMCDLENEGKPSNDGNSVEFPVETKPFSLPKSDYTKEEIIKIILDFINKNKRPPRFNEPNFQNIVYYAEKIFGSWKEALNASGATTYKEWRKRRGLHFTIEQILDHNPLSLHDLKLELEKIDAFSNISESRILSIIGQSKEILSAGTRGHKLYFIKGQEPTKDAYPELNRLDRSRVEEEIFKILVNPMAENEIINHFKANGQDGLDGLIDTSLYRFWREEKIWRVKFLAHAKGGQKYSATDLFGTLVGKTIFCRTDCPGALALYIHENIRVKNDSPGFSTAISMNLKRILPKEVIELI